MNYFIGAGKKYFNKREDKRNLIKEMNDVDVVKNFNTYKKSDADRIGLYGDEPPSIINGELLTG